MRPQHTPSLESLAMRYLAQRRGLGEITRSSAGVYASTLFDFVDAINVPANRIAKRHIERWLERPELSPSYRRNRLSIVRGFCHWLIEHHHLDRDPTIGLRPPKQPEKLPRNLAADDVADLLDYATDVRTRLEVLLMVQECLRRGEVERLQLGDIDRRRRSLGVRGKGGQGHITRRVHLTQETYETMLAYLGDRRGNTGPVIRSKLDPTRGIKGGQIYRDVIKVMRAAGVKHFAGDGRSPHALRHTGAQDLVDDGHDIRKVQRVLGHASLRTTEDYTRGAVRDLAAVMEGRRYSRRQLADVG